MSSNQKTSQQLSSRDRIMLEYQRASLAMTLGFLESQQRVMLAYLSGANPSAEMVDAIRMQQAQLGASLAPQMLNQSQENMEMTVQPQQTLPANFSQTETPVTIAQPVELVTQNNSSTAAPETPVRQEISSSESAGKSADELIAALIDIVSQRTGYPPEMLEPTLDLEADLGIDSIKRVEILNGFRKMLPESSQLSLESGIEQLATVKTLQGIMDWIKSEFGAGKAPQSPVRTTEQETAAPSSKGPSPSENLALCEPKGARLHQAVAERISEKSLLFTIKMGGEEDPYLKDHLFDGVPVMPMAVALELMMEAAKSAYPELSITEVSDLEILAGIVFDSGSADIHVQLDLESSNPKTLRAAVQTKGKVRRTHFKAKIHMAPQAVPNNTGSKLVPFSIKDKQIANGTVLPKDAEIYERFMFHGTLFQGLKHVSAMDTEAISGEVEPTELKQLLKSPGDSQWILNPTLLDSSMQLAGIWARTHKDLTVLPAGFERMTLHSSAVNGKRFHSLIVISPESKGLEIKCDLGIYSEDNKLVVLVEGLKGIGSKALNRLSSRQSEPVA